MFNCWWQKPFFSCWVIQGYSSNIHLTSHEPQRNLFCSITDGGEGKWRCDPVLSTNSWTSQRGRWGWRRWWRWSDTVSQRWKQTENAHAEKWSPNQQKAPHSQHHCHKTWPRKSQPKVCACPHMHAFQKHSKEIQDFNRHLLTGAWRTLDKCLSGFLFVCVQGRGRHWGQWWHRKFPHVHIFLCSSAQRQWCDQHYCHHSRCVSEWMCVCGGVCVGRGWVVAEPLVCRPKFEGRHTIKDNMD